MASRGSTVLVLGLGVGVGACHRGNIVPPASGAHRPSSPLVAEAVARLGAAVPAQGRLAILLSVGAGDGASGAAESLRSAFAGDARVVFCRVAVVPGEPLPDPSMGTGHAATVSQSIEPPPDVVVRISESAGQVYIAARDPSADPLGPPESGWRWTLPPQ